MPVRGIRADVYWPESDIAIDDAIVADIEALAQPSAPFVISQIVSDDDTHLSRYKDAFDLVQRSAGAGAWGLFTKAVGKDPYGNIPDPNAGFDQGVTNPFIRYYRDRARKIADYLGTDIYGYRPHKVLSYAMYNEPQTGDTAVSSQTFASLMYYVWYESLRNVPNGFCGPFHWPPDGNYDAIWVYLDEVYRNLQNWSSQGLIDLSYGWPWSGMCFNIHHNPDDPPNLPQNVEVGLDTLRQRRRDNYGDNTPFYVTEWGIWTDECGGDCSNTLNTIYNEFATRVDATFYYSHQAHADPVDPTKIWGLVVYKSGNPGYVTVDYRDNLWDPAAGFIGG